MAEDQSNDATAAAGAQGAAADGQGIQIGLLAQYVKDLSFENPNAPQSLSQMTGEQKPKIDVSFNVNARRIGEEGFEVELKITSSAKREETAIFTVELVYAGLFGIRGAVETVVEQFLLIEAPRLLFPFARRIVADATRDGGFPPLMLDPVDFAALYRQHKEQQANAAPKAEAESAPIN